jgi:dihydroflavonol-4-reductase
MRVLITGGAGFVGGAVTRQLLARGDDVVALVRDRARTSGIEKLGAHVIEDDLADVPRLTAALEGVDALIHAAGRYRVGIPASERDAMWDANVGTTTRVLTAAGAAAVPKILYVSTVNAFGNTHHNVVDESYRRDLAEGFASWYDETKYRGHEVAELRLAAGSPIVIVLPSQVYGPGDHSQFGEQLRAAFAGTLPYRVLGEVGLGLVHVDDVAAGIVAALDRGVVGRSYVLSGPRTTLDGAIDIAAGIGGHKPPRLAIPTGMVRLLAPLGRLMGQPNIKELVSAASDVTYWASAARAEEELGFRPRSIEEGLRDTFASA